MARPRKHGRKLLPENLYVQKRAAGEYFSYRSPLTGRSISIGYDKAAAISFAEKSNREVVQELDEESLVEATALLSHEAVVSQAYPLGGYSGIYFLVRNAKVVYVGKSLDVEYRLGQHRTARQKDFDSVFIIACDPSKLTQLEARYIRMFEPPLNSAKPIGLADSTGNFEQISDIC